jgi:hypothetical protein
MDGKAKTGKKPVEYKPGDRSEGKKKSSNDQCGARHSNTKHKMPEKYLPVRASGSDSSSTRF